MKKVFFVVAFLSCSVIIFSQTEISERKSKYGIYLGLNHSNLMYGDLKPAEFGISNGLGFNLGILADYQITNWLSFSPKTELSFNSSKVVDYLSNRIYEVMPVNVGLMGHLVVKKRNEKLNPYFFFGPQFRLAIPNKTASSAEFATNNDLAIDLGIGVEKGFKHFNFAPELRYSYGFNNVNQNPVVPLLYFHNISLIFNFTG